jgi:PAS domain S-box-containing protein
MRQLTRLYEARASLEVSRERYALAVAGSDGGIWDFDFAANQAFASTRAREILGVPPAPETQPLDDWFASLELHPDDAPRRLAALKAHLDGSAPAYVGEFRTRHPDRTFRWVWIHGLCMRDANGKPQRMAGSVSDIDARKRAEESLRQSEERFAIAVAGSNDGIIDWDKVTRRGSSERGRRWSMRLPY